MTRLSKTFPSRKNPRSIQSKSSTSSPIIISPIDSSNNNHNKKAKATEIVASSSSRKSKAKAKKTKVRRGLQWSVYLIISSTLPRTYVGVTTNFPRRSNFLPYDSMARHTYDSLRCLKQHNGVLKGGAKASSAGRPWTLACLVRGFKDRSEACEFEYKWKSISRKMPRKKYKEDEPSNSLLQHREAALCKVSASFSCSHLQIEWQSSSP